MTGAATGIAAGIFSASTGDIALTAAAVVVPPLVGGALDFKRAALALHGRFNYNIPPPLVDKKHFGEQHSGPAYRLVVMGDSIAAGAQAVQKPGVIPRAELPMRLAQLISDKLRRPVSLHMVATVGGTYADLPLQIRDAEQELTQEPSGVFNNANADLVLLISGSNDARKRFKRMLVQTPYSNAITEVHRRLKPKEILFATCPDQDSTPLTDHPLIRLAFKKPAHVIRETQRWVIDRRREDGIPVSELDLSGLLTRMKVTPGWFNPGDVHLNNDGSLYAAKWLMEGEFGEVVTRTGALPSSVEQRQVLPAPSRSGSNRTVV